MGIKNNVGIYSLAMMMAMQEIGIRHDRRESRKYFERKEPKKVIPAGCREYFFTSDGDLYTADTKFRGMECVFSCIASNPKVARRKFDKFNKK